MQQQRTVSQLGGDEMKRGFYMTAGDDQLSGWTEKVPQSTFQGQICTKKGSWSLFGGLLPVWSTTAFWIPGKPLHLRSVLSKSMRDTGNCSACSLYWSTEWAQFFSTTMPNHMLHNQCFKSWRNWKWRKQKFPSSTTFTWPLTNWRPLLQASQWSFAGKMLPQPVGCRKRIPRVCQIPKQGFLHYRNKQTYFSLAKMCWLQWFLILVNKDVFEPS